LIAPKTIASRVIGPLNIGMFPGIVTNTVSPKCEIKALSNDESNKMEKEIFRAETGKRKLD
jgi:hypothetical protein